MKLAQIPQQVTRHLTKALAAMAAIFFVGSATPAQKAPESPATAWTQELSKYPGLAEELSRLMIKLKDSVEFPGPRSESRLLPILPPSTIAYISIANYGEASSKTLSIFRQELQESAVLRDWWTHGSPATAGAKIEDTLDKVAQFHQYLGDEIVLSAALDGKEPNFAIVAEVKKPGLKKFLDQIVEQNGGKAKSGLQIMEPLDLATAGLGITKNNPSNALVVLVRPDFVVATGDIGALRDFSARVAQHRHEFASTPFGTRVAQEYQGGVKLLAAADVQKILKDTASATGQSENLQRSGFADTKYVVWKHAQVAGKEVSRMEISFNGPRQGAAAWLAKPAPLGSLDFVSSKPMFAATIVLENLARIFDDMKEISGPASADKFAGAEGMSKAFNLDLKNDLLSLLAGEITVELDSLNPKQQPVWRAILKVTEVNHLQQTLTALLGVTKLPTDHTEDGGITYYTVHVPSGATATEVGYTFVDGYLIVASSPQGVREAVRVHANGGSLAKSQEFLASLPPGESSNASAMFYQNPAAIAAFQLRAFSPGLADSVANSSNLLPGSVIRLYGEESAIREASMSGPLDAAVPLIVAAVAIPNLMRSRVAANEASAVGSVRSVNTAQITYQITYPKRGFAPDLATLGTPPGGGSTMSPERASLLAEPLAESSCTGDAWCIKSGYQFRIKASCKLHLCTEYVVVATPVSAETGTRNFCSTSDFIVRSQIGAPLTAPVTAADCRKWPPLP
jgi:type II secretory pathway pseudopilin PulG